VPIAGQVTKIGSTILTPPQGWIPHKRRAHFEEKECGTTAPAREATNHREEAKPCSEESCEKEKIRIAGGGEI